MEASAPINENLDGSLVPARFDDEPKKCVIGRGSYKFRCFTQLVYGGLNLVIIKKKL